MKLNVKALALTCGLFTGGTLFLVGLANVIWPSYGGAVLNMFDSIYPGYKAAQGFGSVIMGTLYGLVDGAIGGAIFGLLYNAFRGSEA
ncbi:MAG: hypothetical protein E4H37_08675 [Gemmatimonadales bacterium]|nr:MAG: hypothetical protein E4H37_08675 [Gemmatimonadales bacterium]